MKVFTMRHGNMRYGAKMFSIVCLAVGGLSLFATMAQACPMCNQSIAEENLLPHAYMYSIIFMLSMPAVVFTGIGTVIFLQYRKYYSAVPADATDAMAREAALVTQM